MTTDQDFYERAPLAAEQGMLSNPELHVTPETLRSGTRKYADAVLAARADAMPYTNGCRPVQRHGNGHGRH